jgi:hypothetical protein
MAGRTRYVCRNRYLEPPAPINRLGEAENVSTRPPDDEMRDAADIDCGPGEASAAEEPAAQPATQHDPPAEESAPPQARPPRIVRRVLREIDRSGCCSAFIA